MTFAGVEARPYTTDTGMLTIRADAALADIPSPEVFVVPGGPGSTDAAEDEALLGWIRTAHETSEWTTSVCTGAELLGAAGLLDGLDATTYWADMEMLEQLRRACPPRSGWWSRARSSRPPACPPGSTWR